MQLADLFDCQNSVKPDLQVGPLGKVNFLYKGICRFLEHENVDDG
jgi:hypothetical protein